MSRKRAGKDLDASPQPANNLSVNNGNFPDPPNPPTARDVVDQLIAAWNRHDAHGMVALYAEDYTGEDTGRNRPDRGARDILRMAISNFRGFPDSHLTLVDLVAEQNRVAFVWRMTGTHKASIMNIPATDRKIELLGTSIFTIINGKIQSGLRIWDMAAMLRAIGLLPDLQDEAA